MVDISVSFRDVNIFHVIRGIRHATDLLSVSLVRSFRSCDGSGRNATCFSSIVTITVTIEK